MSRSEASSEVMLADGFYPALWHQRHLPRLWLAFATTSRMAHRRLQDLRAHGEGVTVTLQVCRWRCLASTCPRRAFSITSALLRIRLHVAPRVSDRSKKSRKSVS